MPSWTSASPSGELHLDRSQVLLQEVEAERNGVEAGIELEEVETSNVEELRARAQLEEPTSSPVMLRSPATAWKTFLTLLRTCPA